MAPSRSLSSLLPPPASWPRIHQTLDEGRCAVPLMIGEGRLVEWAIFSLYQFSRDVNCFSSPWRESKGICLCGTHVVVQTCSVPWGWTIWTWLEGPGHGGWTNWARRWPFGVWDWLSLLAVQILDVNNVEANLLSCHLIDIIIVLSAPPIGLWMWG